MHEFDEAQDERELAHDHFEGDVGARGRKRQVLSRVQTGPEWAQEMSGWWLVMLARSVDLQAMDQGQACLFEVVTRCTTHGRVGKTSNEPSSRRGTDRRCGREDSGHEALRGVARQDEAHVVGVMNNTVTACSPTDIHQATRDCTRPGCVNIPVQRGAEIDQHERAPISLAAGAPHPSARIAHHRVPKLPPTLCCSGLACSDLFWRTPPHNHVASFHRTPRPLQASSSLRQHTIRRPPLLSLFLLNRPNFKRAASSSPRSAALGQFRETTSTSFSTLYLVSCTRPPTSGSARLMSF